MNRRQLAFVILVNALVSLAVALGVAWAIEARRPDPEELAAIFTPGPAPVLAAPAPIVEPTATVSAPEQSVAPPAADSQAVGEESDEGEPYVVEAGDSLLSIAGKFGVTVDDIVKANGLTNPDFVFSGQRLTIPARGSTQTAAAGTPTASPTVVAQGVQIARFEGAGDLASEQVLIVNESNIAVNLQGWRFEREGGPGLCLWQFAALSRQQLAHPQRVG
ncbi:MAG: LysM peptidoglycan-binding domain-containing protein [Caldilineaceae bacterium]|nr:LysM peptidoglycan-binding domain-containing protein [Caldilineaceae bacterium]